MNSNSQLRCFKSILQTMNLQWKFLAFALVLHFLPAWSLNSDGILLLSFKYSVLSDPLSVLQTWNYDDETPCSWTGVTCASLAEPGSPDPFRVISLVLPESQLLGSVPSDLGLIQHLRHLDLSGNFLNGSLPASIFNATELQVLSLSNNVITGELPDLVGQLTSLQFVNLSDNAFAGSLPDSLSALTNLSVLSLRSNYFSGNVPSGFNSVEILDLSSNLFNGSLPLNFNGQSLHYLNLSYNKLSGIIPPEFGKRIPANATVDLSYNNLTGEIPILDIWGNQERESFRGNLDLCGKPLKIPCSIPSTLTTRPNVSSTDSPPAIAVIPKTIDPSSVPSSPVATSGNQSKALKPGAIAGIAVGDLAGIGLLAMLFLYVYQLKKKKKEPTDELKNGPAESPEPVSESRGAAVWSCVKGSGEMSEVTSGSNSEDDFEEKLTRDYENRDLERKEEGLIVMVDGETKLEMETLLKASAYVLGSSGSSIVYKAVLEDGTAFAVRRLGEGGVERLKDFENQVRLIAKLRHPNLVRVRGFYWSSVEKLLICDYVSNGSLAGAGYRRGSSSPLHMTLQARLKIARGVARGLTYIHDKKHVHGNLKPNNILLNTAMEPIIADFGLDRLIKADVTHKPGGSARYFGIHRSTASREDHSPPTTSPYAAASATHAFASPYHAPEAQSSLKLNSKWDVYSFGILLLELLAGKVFTDRELGQWAGGSLMEESQVLRMADVAIRGELAGMEKAMVSCFKLGFGCASLVPQRRPSMKEALQTLERIPTLSY